ncbi:unnamed protein product [Urochloa decumbens]|uniref:MATH domain-containing protein n=1 Tax=Urochloa decumbens TaxID=240449 RepID=A0ABC9BXD4_9POAL
MSSYAPPQVPLLTAAGAAPPSRSASAVVANAERGFHVFRIDGYSVTTTLPAGERVTSEPFDVGGRSWLVDCYPNGTDASADSTDCNAIAVYLRLEDTNHDKERVRAQYKFGLLDAAGTAAYELPVETGIFASAGGYGDDSAGGDPGCGYASFITKEDLARRRDILLKEDSLAIRCDVAVAEVVPVSIAPPVQMRDARMGRGRGRVGRWGGRGRGGCGYNNYSGGGCDYESPDEYDGSDDGDRGKRGQQLPPDDREFIRRCLTSQRRKNY